MIQFKDSYRILNINANSIPEEIHHSFRKLSLRYHPDIKKESLEKYKEITEAYNTLKNFNMEEYYLLLSTY